MPSELKLQIAKDEQKALKPSQRREMALNINEQNKTTSIKLVCEVCSISKSTYYYKPKLSDENAMIADYLLRLTTTHKRWGFKLCSLYLRNVKGDKLITSESIAFTEN